MDKKYRYLLGMLTLILNLAPAQVAWAQASQPTENQQLTNPAPADSTAANQDQQAGEVCTPPQFRFEWQGTSELALVMKADTTSTYELKIRPHRSSRARRPSDDQCNKIKTPKGCGEQGSSDDDLCKDEPRPRVANSCCNYKEDESEWWSSCLIETRKGDEVRLDLNPDNFDLLKADGLLVISWQNKSLEVGKGICPEHAQGQTDPIVALQRHTFAVDSGPVFSLEENGDYETGTELAVTAYSRFTKHLSWVAITRLSRIGMVEENNDPTASDSNGDAGGGDAGGGDAGGGDAGGGDAGEGDAGEGDANSDDVFNPFAEGGNILSFEMATIINPRPQRRTLLVAPFSILLGAGFTTRPGDASELDARLKLFAGLRIQVARFSLQEASNELSGASGYLQFGYAHNDLWDYTRVNDADGDPMTTDDRTTIEIDEKDRWFFDSQVLIPAIGTNDVQLKLRFYADVPMSGDGPSDVRLSALFQFNLSGLLPTFGRP